MQLIHIIIFFLLYQYICNEYKRSRFGYYRKQEITSQEYNIPKVWEAVQEHSNLVAKITKIGVYTKLGLGMEYQLFFMTIYNNTNEIQIFQSQAYIKGELTNRNSILVEYINQLESKGRMSIHHNKYQMIHHTLYSRASLTKSKYLYIISVKEYYSGIDSEEIYYFDVKVRFIENLESKTKRFIIEEENGTFKIVHEIY